MQEKATKSKEFTWVSSEERKKERKGRPVPEAEWVILKEILVQGM
jgi:predicted transcriptional regulator